jgi:DoxX-like family
MRTMDWRTVAYWVATALFAGLMLLSASMYLSGAAPIRDVLAQLGYPAYLLTILGTAKLLGALSLLQRPLPTLREWAYAGFTINLLGAAASHLLAGDGIGSAVAPAMLLVPLGLSYRLQPGRYPVAIAARVGSPVAQPQA